MIDEIPVEDDLLCWDCVADPVLIEQIRNEGKSGKCSFCKKRRRTLPLSKISDDIDEALRTYYRPGEEEARFTTESDNPYYEQRGESINDIIQRIAGVEPGIADAIEELLSEGEQYDPRDGDEPFYSGDALMEHAPLYESEFMAKWIQFEHRLKHQVRFFDDEGKRMLDDLFADLPNLAGGNAIVTIEPEREFSTLHRARIAQDQAEAEDFLRDPARHIGPPRSSLARAGRMNPAGIPAFYGAFAPELAIAEVRPPVGAIVALGQFTVLRPLKLLDLTFLPHAYHSESIFSLKYDEMRDKVFFLERFHRRIAKPVLPSDEALAYLPTQAVAAYVANVLKLDGIIYASTQTGDEGNPDEQVNRKSCNIVLFGTAAGVEPTINTPNPAKPPSATTADGDTDSFDEITNPTPSTGVEISFTSLVSAPMISSVSLTDVETEDTQLASGPPALRINPKIELVKIKAIRVDTSPMFAHLYESGRVIIDDYDDDD